MVPGTYFDNRYATGLVTGGLSGHSVTETFLKGIKLLGYKSSQTES